MEKQLDRKEIRIAVAVDFETFLTARELQTPNDTIELKSDTVFAGSKDLEPRQTRTDLFMESRGFMMPLWHYLILEKFNGFCNRIKRKKTFLANFEMLKG